MKDVAHHYAMLEKGQQPMLKSQRSFGDYDLKFMGLFEESRWVEARSFYDKLASGDYLVGDPALWPEHYPRPDAWFVWSTKYERWKLIEGDVSAWRPHGCKAEE